MRGCTCGKWLSMTLLERRRTMHAECGVHSRRVAFDDAAGAEKNNACGMQKVHLRRVALTLRGRRRTMHRGCKWCTRGEWLLDAAGAWKNNASWMQRVHSRRVALGHCGSVEEQLMDRGCEKRTPT